METLKKLFHLPDSDILRLQEIALEHSRLAKEFMDHRVTEERTKKINKRISELRVEREQIIAGKEELQ